MKKKNKKKHLLIFFLLISIFLLLIVNVLVCRGDPNGQYWLGMERDALDTNNWKWLTGKTVTVSFWNLPGGDEDCAR